jgi:tetratricopeptide (TPR) repeat protein
MRNRHLHRLTIALLGAFLPLLLMSHAAQAQDVKAQAKQHFSAGEARFKAGDYRAAIAEFGAADQLVPSPILSYNIGLCHERLGEDDLAVQRYRDYLVRRPDAANRAQVEDRIAQAEQRLAAKKPAAPAPVAPPATAEGPAAPKPAPPAPPQAEGPAAPGPPTEGPAAPSVATPPPAGNVDEDLARRLPRRPGTAAPAPAPAPGAGNGLGALAQASPPTRGDAEMAPPLSSEPSAPAEADKHSKAKPLYKEWWFWAVVGVSAIIVIDMASGSDSSNMAKQEAPGGAVLLRF